MSGYRKLVAILLSALALMTVGIAPAGAVAPDAPGSVTASVVDGDSVNVTWTVPADNGTAISSYSIVATPAAPGGAVVVLGPTETSGTVDGLTPGVSYTFVVGAFNALAEQTDGLSSNAVVPDEVPGTPAAPTTGATTETSIVVTWVAPTNNGTAITGYTVSATTGGTTTTQTTAGATTLTFTGLASSTPYTFTVHATNAAGDSAESGSSPAETTDAASAVPATPGAPAVSVQSATSIDVSWIAPADNGSAITQYTVSATTGGTTTTQTTAGVSLTFNGLTTGLAYTFRVHATNGVGDSPQSAASSSITPAAIPGTPGTPTASVASSTSATVSWAAAPANGAAVTYTVAASNGGGTDTTTSTSLTFGGLTAGQAYTFTVTAANAIGTGGTSGASNSVTPTAIPGGTGVPTVGIQSATSVNVSWNAANGNGSSVTGYTVSATTGGTTTTQSTAGTSLTFTGLSTGSAYTFRVHATNGVGDGPQSGASTSITPAGLPGTPGVATASLGGATSVDVTWAAAPTNGAAVTYTVTATPGGTQRTTGGTSLTFGGLTTGTAYTFTVAAANGIGSGGTSAASNSVTPASTPAKPAQPTATRDGAVSNTITVTWSAPAANGSALTGYKVTLLPGPHELTVAPGVTTVDFESLTSGDYTATVVATNALGDSAASDASASANVPHTPGQVTNIRAVTTTPFGDVIEVTWDPPTDDGGSQVLSYTVKFGAIQANVDAGVSSVTIGPLTVGTHVAEINANTIAGPGLTLKSNSVEVQGKDGFIEQQYADFLGRQSDAGGVTYWRTQTADDEANVAEIIVRFMRSAEFAPSRSVARLYLAYFERDPDLEGFDFWYKRLAAGEATIENVSQNFATGAEFKQKYGKLVDRAFVELVYLNVLGRDGEEEGVVFWTGQLTAGMSRGQMMTSFSESPENIVATSAEVDVIVTYRGMLDRKPDSEGRTFWVGLIGNDSNAIYSLVANFYNLPEYQARVR